MPEQEPSVEVIDWEDQVLDLEDELRLAIWKREYPQPVDRELYQVLGGEGG